MTGLAWKPGDVAMVLAPNHTHHVAVRTNSGDWLCPWSGDGRTCEPLDARPLVVIDPEDRTQMVAVWCKVANALNAAGVFYDGSSGERIDAMQAALRELADPTPPPKCPASIAIAGTVLDCEKTPGHRRDHRNDSIGQGVRWGA